MIKTLCTTLAIVLTVFCMGAALAAAGSHAAEITLAQAPAAPAVPEPGGNGPPQRKLVGSWVETVMFLDPPFEGRLLKSLVSFHSDGTMVTSDQGSVTTDPPSVSSSGHGAWLWVEKQKQFAYTVVELFSDLSGNLVGYLKVRGIYTVLPSGDNYTGTSFFQVFDASGNLQASGNVNNAGE